MLQKNKRNILIWAVAYSLCAALFSCSSLVTQVYDKDALYRGDISIKVTGLGVDGKKTFEKKFIGVGVLPMADSYKIEGSLKQNADFLLWQTCAQQKSIERVGDDFEIVFKRNALENVCNEVLEIRTFEESKNRHGGAIIAFDQPEKYKLASQMICNGDTQNTGLGVSICQAMHGLYQAISFPVAGKWFFAKPECQPKKLAGKDFVFQMPSKVCAGVFMEDAAPNRRHLLLLYPYDDIILVRK